MFENLSLQQWLLALCIPIAGAAAGYAVNLLSTILTYGIDKNSQLGLIQFKRQHFARQLYRQVLEGKISTPQLYEHMGPEKMVKQIVRRIKPRLDNIVDDAMEREHGIFWENLPITVKNRFYGRAHKLLPRVIDDVVEDIGDNIERLARVDDIINQGLDDGDMSIAWIIKQSSLKHLNKLPLQGVFTGYFLGVVLLFVWLLFPHWLTLLLGYTLLSIIIAWIGLKNNLSKRQMNTATLSHLLAEQLLSPASIMRALLTDNGDKHVRNLIKKHTSPIIEQASLRTFAQLTIGPTGYATVKQQLANNISEAYLDTFNDPHFNAPQKQQIEEYLNKNLTQSSEGPKKLTQQINKALTPVMLPVAALVGSFAGLSIQCIMWTF